MVNSVNVGRVRGYTRHGRAHQSAIWKRPSQGPVAVRTQGLDGDEHASSAHGGDDQAVYAYSREEYEFWERELGRELSPGVFGENLTTVGLDLSRVTCGQRIRCGSALLEATQPRLPCSTFEHRMGIERWVERFSEHSRFGVYFRVLEEGVVAPGDTLEPVDSPELTLTIYEMGRIRLFQSGRAHELLQIPQLGSKWRAWALSAAES